MIYSILPLRITLLSVSVAILSLLPFVTFAETVVRTSNVISIASEQIIEEDFYAAASAITMSGLIKGDMHAMAGTLTHNGVVESDISIVGGSVQLHGKVADDARVIGGEVTIGSEITGDLFVFAGSLTILSTAKIGGDVFFFGNTADIEGEIGGSVMGTYTTLRLNGIVKEDVDLKASAVTLGDRANIAGHVRYESASELVRSQNAVVTGDITKQAIKSTPDVVWRNVIASFLLSLFASLAFYLVMRQRLQVFVTRDCAPVVARGLLGIFSLIGLPIAAVVLMLTVLGFWLGLLLLASWFLLLVLAYLLLPIVLGSWLWQVVTKKPLVNTLTVLLGTVLLFALLQLPILGIIISLLLSCVIAGGLIMAVYKSVR